MKIIIVIGITLIVIMLILLNRKNTYTAEDYHNDIMKDYDEERWIEYQKTEEFLRNET